MALVQLVVALALLQFIVFGMAVGWARGKFGVKAPATTGNEVFERYFRVQMNTLEQLVVFVPAILLFATVNSATWAAILGAVWLIGRVIFFYSYTRNPASRGLGFMLTMLPNTILVVGVLIAAARAAIAA
jgi:glutathione S-transferase